MEAIRGASVRLAMEKKVTRSTNRSLYQSPKHARSVSDTNVYYDMYTNRMLCDGIIRLDDGGVFQVHRGILATASPFLQSLFLSPIYDREKWDVTIQGVSSNTMPLIMEFVYTRRANISNENVQDLLVAADYLQLEGLFQHCCLFLQKQIDPSNCIGIWNFASNFPLAQKLHTAATTFLTRHFEEVADESEELLELSIERITTILFWDELNVKDEEVVWNTVVKWVNVNPSERRVHMAKLLRAVRLGLMDASVFLDIVKPHPYVLGSDECRPIIIDTLKFLYDMDMITVRKQPMPTPYLARPRLPSDVLFTIGGWITNRETDYIETYDVRADRWLEVGEMDTEGPRSCHAAAVIGHKIYVIGGQLNNTVFKSCRCFDAVTKEWTDIAPMKTPRCYVTVVVLGNVIYAIGGHNGRHRVNTVEKYQLETNKWSFIAPMNVIRSDVGAATIGSKIYVAGGFSGDLRLDLAEVYDPVADRWTIIRAMSTPRSGLKCVAYNGWVYAIGGFSGETYLRSVEKYDPENNAWQSVPDMHYARTNCAVVVMDDMIIVMGGWDGRVTTSRVECFYESCNHWRDGTNMNLRRSGLSASVVRGLPNILDYVHNQRDQLMEEKRLELQSS